MMMMMMIMMMIMMMMMMTIMLRWLQIAEEGNHDDSNHDNGDKVQGTSSRAQFAENVGKPRATNASTPVKDAALLQPCTTDDGYLTPTTRTTSDDADVSYLKVVDSPTDEQPASA